jgi:hypothetical protein
MMHRENLQPTETRLEPHSQTAEMKFAQPLVRVLVSGIVQVSFPGYGVIQLKPGDILEINPHVLHDMIVSSSQPAVLLESVRKTED